MKIMKDEKCYYCNQTPYGDTSTLKIQRFNDGTISSIKLNPHDTRLLTSNTCNIPDKGASNYRIIARINYCPMCGRNLKNQ